MFVFVPSPFLGSSTWTRVVQAVQARGRACAIVDLKPAIERGADAYAYVADLASRWRFVDPTFVAHSGAGALMPSILSAAANPAACAILVDGLMPHPGRSWLETAPPGLGDRVVDKATGGAAEPWPSWFGSRLSELLPNPDDRAFLEADAPRVPLDFLRQVAPAVIVEPEVPYAYIRLSESYEPEAREAEAQTWLVRRVEGHHLWPITHPVPVADAIVELDFVLRQ